MALNMDEVVQVYLKIRDARAKLQQSYEEEDRKFKDDLKEIEQTMLEICNEANISSIKTEHGTVIRKLNERYYCQDWEGFREFEIENPEYDFREKRIHQSNFKSYMEEHDGDGLPPGVNVLREYTVTVRRSNSSGE